MKTYFCNGAETRAPSLRAAAHAFAALAAFDAYGEDGIASSRYLIGEGSQFRAHVGTMSGDGLIRGYVVLLTVTEIERCASQASI